MKVRLDNLLEEADPDTLRCVKHDALKLKSLASDVEHAAKEELDIDLGLPESANVIGSMRWPNHIDMFVHQPDPGIRYLFYKNGLYERSKDQTPSIQQGLNNGYISWSASISVFAAYDTHSIHEMHDKRLSLVEAELKYCPFTRLDLRNSSFLSKICSYDGVGEQQKSRFVRGLIYSLPGELVQNIMGISEEPELRGCLLGLSVLDDILAQGGTTMLESTKLSEFIDIGMSKIGSMGYHVRKNPELKEYIDHFNSIEHEKGLTRFFRHISSAYINAAETHLFLRKIPVLGYFYRNVRPSIDDNGYNSIPYNSFPKPLSEQAHM